MGDRGDLRPDADGFVDMTQFEATDPAEALDDETYARLHDLLVRAAVPIPGPDRLDELVERAFEAEPEPPDTAELVPDDVEPPESGEDEAGAVDEYPVEAVGQDDASAGDIEPWTDPEADPGVGDDFGPG